MCLPIFSELLQFSYCFPPLSAPILPVFDVPRPTKTEGFALNIV